MSHFISPSFLGCYKKLPLSVQQLADKNFELMKKNREHPSLHFKRVGKYRSMRVGKKYRALSLETEDGMLWFWIGAHAEYDNLIK